MQNYPDQLTETMGDRSDGFVVSQTWHEATVHDVEDASFVFDGSIRSRIEDAAQVAITLR
jgi:hypothetical protein